jgi:hypothetical protein
VQALLAIALAFTLILALKARKKQVTWEAIVELRSKGKGKEKVT